MKILVITQTEFPHLQNNKFCGGIHKCEFDQINILSKYHEVTVLTPKDSLPFLNIETINYWQTTKEFDTKKQNEFLKVFLFDRKFDLILCHSWQVSTHISLSKLDIPVIIFHHVTPDNLGGLLAFGKVDSVYKTYNNGCLSVWPSNACVIQWKEFIKKSSEKYPTNFSNPKDYLDRLDHIVNRHLYPFIAIEDFPINHTKKHTIALVSRLDKGKSPKKSIEFCQINGLDLKIFAPSIESEYSREVYLSYRKNFDHEVFVGLERKELLNEISKCSYLINCIPSESFSIVSAEAICMGIPVISIIHKKYPTASLEAGDSSYSIGIDSSKDKVELCLLDKKEKEELANSSKKKYSEEEFLNNFNSLAKEAIRYKESMKVNTLDL